MPFCVEFLRPGHQGMSATEGLGGEKRDKSSKARNDFSLCGKSEMNNPTLIWLPLVLLFIYSAHTEFIITSVAGKWRSNFILALNVIKMTSKR